MRAFVAPLIEQAGNVRLPCDSCVLISISHRHLVAMMQGQNPGNFDIDDYNTLEIRASASTIDEYITGERMKNRKNARGSR